MLLVGSVGLTSIQECFVSSYIFCVSQKSRGKLGKDTWQVVSLALTLDEEQVSDNQVLEELSVNRVVLVIDHLLEVLDKFLEHFTKNLELYIIDSGQDFDSNSLVDRQHLLDCRGVVSSDHSCSFFELSLLQESLGEFHQVGI